MVEWWQVLLISVASSATVGLVGLATAYFVHRWTRQGAIEVEERQARRDQRRDAMQPVIQFLKTAAKADAVRTAKSSIRGMYDDNVANIQDIGPYERVEEAMLRDVESAPSQMAITRDFYLASSAAPTAKWFVPLFAVWSWVGQTEGGSSEKLRSAIQKVRNLVENYIAAGTTNGAQ